MKKTAIVFAILLCVSIIACAASGAAVGMEAINGYFHGDFSAKGVISALDSLEDIDWDNSIKDGKTLVHEESKNLVLSKDKSLKITADVCALKVQPTDNSKAYAKFELYASGAPVSKDAYQLEEMTGELKLTYSGASVFDESVEWKKDVNADTIRRQTTRINALLTVYVPREQLGTLEVQMDTGAVKIIDMKVKNLTANTATGAMLVSGCTAETANLDTATGLIKLENNTIKNSITASVETGLLRAVLPQDVGCNLEYSLKMGSYNVNLDNSTKSGWVLASKTVRQYSGGGYHADFGVGEGALYIETA